MAQTRILIVDDELVIRESLAGWLKRDGYEVGTVAGGISHPRFGRSAFKSGIPYF